MAAFAGVVAFAGSPQGLAQRAAGTYPLELIERVARSGTPHRLLCTTLEWCSYAVALGGPQLSILMDGRIEKYPASVLDAQATIARTKPGWTDRLARSGVDAVVAGRREPLAALLELHGWKQIGADDRALVFARAAEISK